MKILLLIFLLSISLFSSDKELATKIYLSIAKGFSGSDTPKFYLHKKIKFLSDNKDIIIVDNCEEADIIVLNTVTGLPINCLNDNLFSTKYRVYKQNKNIVGAFYWQKGRPNIIFRRTLLNRYKITLDPSFQKYIE